MEREKMIEEMTTFLKCCDHLCSKCERAKQLSGFYDCKEFSISKTLYDAGYRKIHDGAVVLTKEEYDRFEEIKKDTLCKKEEYINGLIELGKEKQDIRKETAREILQEVKSFLDTQTKTVNGLSNSQSRYAIPQSCNECYKGSQENRIAELKRIAEKYGVEVEE